jgi:hypothetical protein
MSITRTGAQRVALNARTQNISSAGVLFTAEREPDLGGAIEYIITLNREGTQPVNLRCVGKVLRAVRLANGPDSFSVAATLERYEFIREN